MLNSPMSRLVIKPELIVLLDTAMKGTAAFKMSLKTLGLVPGFLFLELFSYQRIYISFSVAELLKHIKCLQNVFLTSCCQLWALANTFVIVCILCTKITSWLPNAAYFACSSTVAFKVYPVERRRKMEEEEEKDYDYCSSKGNT